MSSSKDTFRDRLRTARELRQLTQTQLAEATGLQPAAINHFEAGRRSPSFDNLRLLADALEVSVDYLLGRSESAASLAQTRLSPADVQFREVRATLSAQSKGLLDDFAKMLAKNDQEKRTSE